MLKRLFPLFLLAFVTYYFSYNTGLKILSAIDTAKENNQNIEQQTFEIGDFFDNQKLM
ncbi:hypothetical protein [Vibrio sp. 1CM8B]|uniref:hypothetical protein n=1 Tax=Vibrio sp. 1CM8B TaxID=2929167 RepID=UPI0020C02897|nr:hypothetical protein [Vibrio sp. 1CM8B]